MIFVEKLVETLRKNKIDFYTGVPDSMLKNLSIILDNFSKKKHIIATNEEFFLRPILSSIIIADTPSLSKVLIVNDKCYVLMINAIICVNALCLLMF